MSKVSTIVITSNDDLSVQMRADALSPQESVQRISDYMDQLALGCGHAYVDMQVEGDSSVQASGTITLSSFVSGDTMTVGGQVFTGITSGGLLGRARSFGLLGASAVTSTGSTVVTGDVGSYPTGSITGFPPGTASGTIDSADAKAQNAQVDASAAYTSLAGHGGYVSLSASTFELGGSNLSPGYYSIGTSGSLSGVSGALTLTGTATDVFVIKTGSTLITGASGVPVITLAGGALAANVYFLVGSSATLNSGSAGTFNGNVIAQVSITDTIGGTVNGSLLALTGAVTLSAAAIVNAQSVPAPTPSANQFVISSTDALTATNAAAAIAALPALSGVVQSAVALSNVITVKAPGGALGNYVDLAISAHGSVSAAHLSGGVNGSFVRMHCGL